MYKSEERQELSARLASSYQHLLPTFLQSIVRCCHKSSFERSLISGTLTASRELGSTSPVWQHKACFEPRALSWFWSNGRRLYFAARVLIISTIRSEYLAGLLFDMLRSAGTPSRYCHLSVTKQTKLNKADEIQESPNLP